METSNEEEEISELLLSIFVMNHVRSLHNITRFK